MNSDQLLILLLVLVTADFVWERVLSYLDDRSNKRPLPPELEGIYDKERYEESLRYQRTRSRFETLSASISFAIGVVLLATGAFGWLDQETRYFMSNELFASFAFFAVLYVAADLFALPFSLYSTFVIEERFGFNKMTLKTFVLDKLKGYLLTALLGAPLLAVFLYLIWSLGTDFWLYFLGVIVLFMVLANLFYTSIILPLFNKLTPLEEGELKQAIEDYAAKVQFPLKNIYVIDGSRRSSKSNAFFSGFGKRKKIVLYDTLIENHTTEELVAVLAHEVGHYKKKHIYTGLFTGVLQTALTLFILSRMVYSTEISWALGGNSTSISLNLLAFGILYSPISHLLGLLSNALSRKHEFEADAWAATTYDKKPLLSGLKKLASDNMSALQPHRLSVVFHYSHPPLKERLAAIKKH